MKLTRQKKSEALIPTGSMADIAFLLIIFFMVTTVQQNDRTRVELPLSQGRIEADKKAAIVVVYNDPETGAVAYKFSDGESQSEQVPTPNEVYAEAGNVLQNNGPGHQFMLKADGDVKFRYIDEMMDTLRRAGVQQLVLLTKEGRSY